MERQMEQLQKQIDGNNTKLNRRMKVFDSLLKLITKLAYDELRAPDDADKSKTYFEVLIAKLQNEFNECGTLERNNTDLTEQANRLAEEYENRQKNDQIREKPKKARKGF